MRPAPPSRFALPARDAGLLEGQERELLLGHVRALLEAPTAPYAEDAPSAVVRAFAREREGFELARDAHANLLVAWTGAGAAPAGPRLAFSAHLDHPGFEALGGGRARLHGGIPARFLAEAPLRFFPPGSSEACGTARVAGVREGEARDVVVELGELSGEAPQGAFGILDLTAGTLRGTRLESRVCDDLLGAAAILTLLDLLARARHPAPVLGIFTRAEETGFVGCQGLLRDAALDGGVRVVGLECSPRRAAARLGHGPVIRVGDAATLFDPALTHHLQQTAGELARSLPGFRAQRALMDGGRCESTAYNLWGVPAGGLCLALASYHNCGRDGRVAPEAVDWNDLEGLVALMRAAARSWERAEQASATMRRLLDGVWEAERGRLTRSAARLLEAEERAARPGGGSA